jgi:hypothetical protein
MAYDRYDTRDEQPRWRESRDRPHQPGGSEDKGFFERASDEIASWFGDDRSDRGGPDDRRHGREERGWRPEREHGRSRDDERGYGRDPSRDRGPPPPPPPRDQRERSDRNESYRGTAWPSSEGDYNPSWRDELRGERDYGRQRGRNDEGGYRPMAGDYARSEQMYGSGDRNPPRGRQDDQSQWSRDEYRSTSRAGSRDQSDRSREFDPHYHSWRDRHMSDLDRDYEDYRREHQSKFENDFSSWRERRTHKRGLLGQVREQMQVVGSDDKPVGTVERVAGDRLILAKSDPESGGSQYSLSCSQVDRIESDRVILDCPADRARDHWRDETRSRALFEREDQGEMGNHVLNRSFEGTYR